MRYVVAIFLISVIAANSAVGRDVFVDNVGGNDVHNGSAPDSRIQGLGPCRTIAKALRVAQKGDRIVLANKGEPYRESITLQGGRHSGSEERPFEFIGNGAVIDGSVPVPDDSWEQVRGHLFRFEPRLKSYQQLFIDDVPASRRLVTGDGLMPKLKDLEWCLYKRTIYFQGEKDRLPQGYNLSYAGRRVGITLYEVRHVIIREVIVQGFQLDGINAHDSAFDTHVVSSTCRGNGRSGISVGGSSRMRIDSCLVGNNGHAQVRTEGFSKTWIANCDLLDNTAPKIVKVGGRVFIENDDAEGTSKE